MTPHDQLAHAHEARRQYAAERAAKDPVKLARSARIVRTALARGGIKLTDIVDGPPLCDCRKCSAREAARRAGGDDVAAV